MGYPEDAGMSEAGSGTDGLLRDIANAERIALAKARGTVAVIEVDAVFLGSGVPVVYVGNELKNRRVQ